MRLHRDDGSVLAAELGRQTAATHPAQIFNDESPRSVPCLANLCQRVRWPAYTTDACGCRS